MGSGDIKIDPFSGQLEPASYDLRVGATGQTRAGKANIAAEGYIQIPRGAIVVVNTLERITLSTNLTARYGLRSALARRGLVLLSGPQIDPGFAGILHVTLFNAGADEVTLAHEQSFATIEFSFLRTAASAPYRGPYQNQDRLTAEEVSAITRPYKNFTEIEDSLRKTEIKQSVLQSVLYAILTGVIAGVVLLLLQQCVTGGTEPLPTPSLMTP